MNPEPKEETESKEEIEVDYDVKPMNLTAVNGKVYMRVGDSMVEQTVPPFPKDGRFSPENKAWAKGISINNSDEDRRKFYVTSHPALLDGFITVYRRYVKEFKEQSDKEDKTLSDYTKVTARGDNIFHTNTPKITSVSKP